MTVTTLREPATATSERGGYSAANEFLTTRTHLATARSGRVCAEKLNLMVFTGRVVGWVVEFLASATSLVPFETQQHSTAAKRIAALWDDVDAMTRMQPDWNGYGSEPPNEFSRDLAKQILLSATSVLVPNRVAASAQGGVGICFYQGNKYGDIECLNSGEILATISDGIHRPEVWEVKPSDSRGALERIGKYIAS